jgi:hypothetical protein
VFQRPGDGARADPQPRELLITDADAGEMVPAAQLRAQLANPSMLDAARIAYRAADARLRARGANGAIATLWMIDADGRTVVGHDRYRFAPPGWLAEHRSDRITLAIGGRVCNLPLHDPQWQCDAADVEYGLPSIEWRAIWAATQAEVACGATRCRRLMLAIAAHLDLEGSGSTSALYISKTPQAGGRRVVLDLDADSGDPRRLHIIEIVRPGRVAVAVYDFELDRAVEPFRLPY